MRRAARITHLHLCPTVASVVPHVGGPIVPSGEPTVLIAGLPAARESDEAVCCGPPTVIVVWVPTTLIGGFPVANLFGEERARS